MTKFDVIGFGALNVDNLFKVDKIATAEEESFVMDYSESCGGSAANTMVGLARLGCKTGFIGKVAEDREGKMQLDAFTAEGVNTDGITVSKVGKSGSVMGYVDRKGQRALYINPGVNDIVEPREITWEYVSQTKFLHLTSFVGEKSLRAQKKLVGSIPEDIKISFDPGSVYAQKGFAAIEPIIRSSYLMMPNALELEMLTGETDYQKGAQILIEGTVMDQSPAQPNTPCVSKDSMTLEMEHIHMAMPLTGLWGNESITGVPVTLTAIAADGTVTDIGTVTTNGYYGTFGTSWTPPKAGEYTIMASFAGDDSYGSSSAATFLSVGPAATVAPTQTLPPQLTASDVASQMITYLVIGIVAIIIAIAIATVLIITRK